MASAIIGGLLNQGHPLSQISVLEPFEAARDKLLTSYGITAQAEPGAFLARATLMVWAVKPQSFQEAAQAVRAHAGQALHLSVAAGIRCDSMAAWLGSERLVRSMPNTPALIGRGITALFARPGVSQAEREGVAQVLRPTGELLWLEDEAQLDAVTALSGSGPAYVFYFLEAMQQAGAALGLSAQQARQLAQATFAGAAELARASDEPLELLRQRVTSKGGTTAAALGVMEASQIGPHFVQAMQAAHARAQAMGEAFRGIDATP